MPAEVDKIANDVRRRAREKNIATLDAMQFWRSIKGFLGPDFLEVKPGENAGEAQSDNSVAHWHHYVRDRADEGASISLGQISLPHRVLPGNEHHPRVRGTEDL